MEEMLDPVAAFIEAACVPLDSGHSSGTLDRAQSILAEHPQVAGGNINTAAILGDDESISRFVERDPAAATVKSGPRGWDPLTYLCFSRYLRLDRARSSGFVSAAAALLDAGASANTGWFEMNHQPTPEWESAIYGAAGVAHHPELTQLLLDHGADPNDEETPYHAPEGYDNRALKVLVKSGKLTDDSLTTILLRKTDWHDYEGIKWLLEQGIDPNRTGRWGKTALHNAVLSDNRLEIIEALMDHGADPTILASHPGRGVSRAESKSAIAVAARRGRSDVMELFEKRGIPTGFEGVERIIAACARNDTAAVRSIVGQEPQLVRDLLAQAGELIAAFAGVENPNGVRQLLDLGVDVKTLFKEGEGYFDIAPNSMAIHVAAWRANHATLKLLIQRGSPIDVPDGKGRTPLALAVKACVDSYWTERRTPESVEALLRAGAPVSGVRYPSGYEEVDVLLRSYQS
jgi:ankyrin repeat protein